MKLSLFFAQICGCQSKGFFCLDFLWIFGKIWIQKYYDFQKLQWLFGCRRRSKIEWFTGVLRLPQAKQNWVVYRKSVHFAARHHNDLERGTRSWNWTTHSIVKVMLTMTGTWCSIYRDIQTDNVLPPRPSPFLKNNCFACKILSVSSNRRGGDKKLSWESKGDFDPLQLIVIRSQQCTVTRKKGA